jgi:acetyl esterase/lipase
MIAGFGIMVALALSAYGQEVHRLYAGPAPGSEDWTHEEKEFFSTNWDTDVVTNVTQPTLTAYLPDPDKATGTAVIIAPGGGFHGLSINSEGVEVAQWLNERGVAGFVLRYRLFPTGEDGTQELAEKFADRPQLLKDIASVLPLSGADGLAAVGFVRQNADKFGIAPDRIGFMGFSAGGGVTMYVTTHYDAATRPDFIAPIYAGAADVMEVPEDAPPMFVVAASDDELGLADDSVTLYSKWLAAGKPAELHMYMQGGHGFGMRKLNLASDTWFDRFYDWLSMLKFTTPPTTTD